MNIKQIKKLSGKRIINMKHLYEKAGLSVASMNTRISRLNNGLSEAEKKDLELAVLDQLKEIVDILEIPDPHVINALELDTMSKPVEVTPCGYLDTDPPTPVFLPGDKIKHRTALLGGEPEFWPEDKIIDAMVSNSRFTLTDRGFCLFIEDE